MVVVEFGPSISRVVTGGVPHIELDAATVGEAIEKIDAQYPGFKPAVCQHSVSVYFGEQTSEGTWGYTGLTPSSGISMAENNWNTPIAEGVTLAFMYRMAGG